MLRALKPRNFIFRIRRIASHDSVVASEVAMRLKKQRTTGSGNLFRARLDRIINMKHELVQLAGKVDWDWIDGELSPKVGDGGNRKGGISWGCLTPPLLHRSSDMPCPTITLSS